jgi:hypothetical protein
MNDINFNPLIIGSSDELITNIMNTVSDAYVRSYLLISILDQYIFKELKISRYRIVAVNNYKNTKNTTVISTCLNVVIEIEDIFEEVRSNSMIYSGNCMNAKLSMYQNGPNYLESAFESMSNAFGIICEYGIASFIAKVAKEFALVAVNIITESFINKMPLPKWSTGYVPVKIKIIPELTRLIFSFLYTVPDGLNGCYVCGWSLEINTIGNGICSYLCKKYKKHNGNYEQYKKYGKVQPFIFGFCKRRKVLFVE